MYLNHQPVDQFDQWRCPHCKALPEQSYEIAYLDTLSIEAGHLAGRLHALFSEVICPECLETSYLIEVNLVSSALEGRAFIADNCWVAEKRGKFHFESAHTSWDCELLENVTLDDSNHTEWLARHMFSLFSELNTGRLVVESLLPKLEGYSEILKSERIRCS